MLFLNNLSRLKIGKRGGPAHRLLAGLQNIAQKETKIGIAKIYKRYKMELEPIIKCIHFCHYSR